MSRIEQIQETAASMKGLDIGTLRIGTFASAASRLLPKILAKFHSKYPKIEVSLFEGTYKEVEDWIKAEVVHIGILTSPNPDFEMIPVTKDLMKVVLPKNHPCSQVEALNLHQIAEDPFILLSGGCKSSIQDIFRKTGVQPKVLMEVRDVLTILNMVQEGIGVSIVPELTIPSSFPGIRTLDIEPGHFRNISIAVNSVERATPAVERFIKITKEEFGYLEEDNQ